MSDGPITNRALSHLEREKEVQWAQQEALVLSLADLRIVRAHLADRMEQNLDNVARERVTIRGEVVHDRIKQIEAGKSNMVRLFRVMARDPATAKRELMEVPEIDGVRGRLKMGAMTFESPYSSIIVKWRQRQNHIKGQMLLDGNVIAELDWDETMTPGDALKHERLLLGGGCRTTTIFRRDRPPNGWLAWRCRFEAVSTDDSRGEQAQ